MQNSKLQFKIKNLFIILFIIPILSKVVFQIFTRFLFWITSSSSDIGIGCCLTPYSGLFKAIGLVIIIFTNLISIFFLFQLRKHFYNIGDSRLRYLATYIFITVIYSFYLSIIIGLSFSKGQIHWSNEVVLFYGLPVLFFSTILTVKFKLKK